MQSKLDQWQDFLSVDEATRKVLAEFHWVVEPHMEALMDTVYRKIASSPEAVAAFKSPDSMARARELQKAHWRDFVFAGRFDQTYRQAVHQIGLAHYRLGVDLRLFSGGCLEVMNALVGIVLRGLADRPETAITYLQALNRAIFMDMGLATSVYYESLLGAVEDMARELNFALARAGEYRDNETGKHITRMSKMCGVLSRALGADAKWCQMLLVASPLHDLGKIGIPDGVLLKPGRLTPEEMEVMRAHPAIGGEIIPDHVSEVTRMARRIALTHHERWDGCGYPAGLRGEEIPLEGRIAAICDVYDALVSSRPYKKAWTREAALTYLRENSGSHFDPALVTAFLGVINDIDAIQKEFAEE